MRVRARRRPSPLLTMESRRCAEQVSRYLTIARGGLVPVALDLSQTTRHEPDEVENTKFAGVPSFERPNAGRHWPTVLPFLVERGTTRAVSLSLTDLAFGPRRGRAKRRATSGVGRGRRGRSSRRPLEDR